MQKTIYIEDDYDGLYKRYWANLGKIITRRDHFLSEPEAFDLVCFTGGEDVSPELYGHRNLMSGNSKRRDEIEQEVFDLAKQWKIPMTGICRGSQFLNVQMGGTMVQHLRKSHGGSPHMSHTKDGFAFPVTSSHHQMSILGKGGVLLGWADEELPVEALVYDGDPREALALAGNLLEDDRILVTEAFAYPEKKIFGAQFHAEWMDIASEAARWQLQKTMEFCWGQERRPRTLELTA